MSPVRVLHIIDEIVGLLSCRSVFGVTQLTGKMELVGDRADHHEVCPKIVTVLLQRSHICDLIRGEFSHWRRSGIRS